MLKIGVRAHDFGKMDPFSLAKAINNAGFTTSQLAIIKAITGVDSLADVNSSLLEQIKTAFAENNVEIGVFGCYVEIGLPDKSTRLSEVEKFITGLKYAKILGAKLVGTETTYYNISSMEGAVSREETYQNLKDSVLRMAEQAEYLGVDIGIETVADHTLYSAELTRRLLDEVNSKHLRVIFDPVNLILTHSDIDRQDEIYKKFIETVGDDVSALHVKDIVIEDGKKIWRNIGKGDINYKTIADWLIATGRSMPVLREHIKPDCAQLDRQAMKDLFVLS